MLNGGWRAASPVVPTAEDVETTLDTARLEARATKARLGQWSAVIFSQLSYSFPPN
jgi:hypothetical protein